MSTPHISVLLALTLLPASLTSQHLVKDLAPGRSTSAKVTATDLAVFQGKGVFLGTNSAGGAALWTTDGTPAGTAAGDNAGADVLFAASSYCLQYSRSYPFVLWRSDATPGSTTLLSSPDTATTGTGVISGFAEVPGRVLFCLTNGQLWSTDGTSTGTSRIATNFVAPPRPELPRLVILGGHAYFSGSGANGVELWRSDGTAAGTTQVVDIAPGGSSGPGELTVALGRLWFNADDGVHGRELWISDGTAAGTQMLYDLPNASTFASRFVEWNGAVWFRAFDPVHGYELWRSDGTTAGTGMAVDTAPGIDSTFPEILAPAGNRLFVTTSQAGIGGEQLLVTDGTPAGTRSLLQLAPPGTAVGEQRIVAVGSRVFFKAKTAAEGVELWTSDGTQSGTRLVADLMPGASSSTPSAMTTFGTKLLFLATTGDATLGTGVHPFVTDGTAAGTVSLWQAFTPPGASSPSSDFAELHGLVWFGGNDAQGSPVLWSSDGTSQGTRVAIDARTAPFTLRPVGITTLGERLHFFSNDLNGPILWTSDGTAQGTSQLATLGYWTQFGRNLAGVPGLHMFLMAAFDVPNQTLWRSDGTVAGTYALVALPTASFGNAYEVGAVDGVQYLITQGSGAELWRSDGTRAGTSRVATFTGTANATCIWRGHAYLLVSTAAQYQVWTSDGTAAGTVPIVEPALAGVGDGLLAGTDDAMVFGFKTSATTATLWKNPSGQKNAHVPMQSITVAATAPTWSAPSALPSRLVLSISDGAAGSEPWVIEPSTDSVRRLRDVYPGLASGCSSLTLPKNGARSPRIPFAAGDPASGGELWVTDGTAAGTRQVADLNPGPGSSSPSGFTRVADRFWFFADDGVNGREPFVMPVQAIGASGVDDLGGGCALFAGPVPALRGDSALPVLGSACELTLLHAPPGQAAIVVIALTRADVSPWAGCTIHVGSPEIHWLAATSASGAASCSFLVPPLPVLLGAEVYVQTATPTPALALALSNALRLIVGAP